MKLLEIQRSQLTDEQIMKARKVLLDDLDVFIERLRTFYPDGDVEEDTREVIIERENSPGSEVLHDAKLINYLIDSKIPFELDAWIQMNLVTREKLTENNLQASLEALQKGDTSVYARYRKYGKKRLDLHSLHAKSDKLIQPPNSPIYRYGFDVTETTRAAYFLRLAK